MSGREAILKRVRQALGRGDAPVATRAAAQRYVADHPAGPRPSYPASADELLAAFVGRAEGLNTKVLRATGPDGVPAAVAAYLAGEGLPPTAVAWPELQALDWASAGLQISFGGAAGTDATAITGAYAALVETGTLVILTGQQTPTTSTFLPDTHVAVVDRARLVAGMEDVFQMMRRELGGVPRGIHFISGPSRTGDIEQTIVLGAHGPVRVAIVLVG